MFALRWWRRNDGFEWKDYVRTTVLVRRQLRREKMDAAKAAAVEGVKEAGRKGLAVGAAGAEAAGQAAVKIAKSAAEGAAGGAEKGLALFVRSLAAARTRIADASAPVSARLSAPRVAFSLGLIAGLAGAGFAARAWQFGMDGDAAALGGVALAAATGWLWPRVFANSLDAQDEWTSRTERAVAAADRAASLLPLAGAAVFAAVSLYFAAPSVMRWLNTAGSSVSDARPSADADSLADGMVRGQARVSGPGVLRIAGRTMRLDSITMLDFAQTCRRADGTSWNCGSAAKQAFEKLARSRRDLKCEITRDGDGAAIARCEADGKNLAAELVRQGFAFADGTLWSPYSAQQLDAEKATAGLWAGQPERPEAWRQRLFTEAAERAPEGCPIKGRVQAGRRTYVMPHYPEYARVSLREDRGDRWFCSAEEAEAEGFEARESKS